MNCMQPKLLCAHTFDARPTLPANRRGSAVLNAAHAFGRSFAGQFTAASDVHAMVHKSSLRQLAWLAGSAGIAGRVELGGQVGAGRVVREEWAWWVRFGLGLVVPAVNVPMNGSLRCVPSELARGIKLAKILDT